MAFLFLSYLEVGLPSVDVLKDVHLQEPLRIFTQDGQLIAEYGDVRRIPVFIHDVPKSLIDATLATEDHRFYEHAGVDFIGLARAAIVVLTTGRKEQGGSTITMQVARNFFLSNKKTYLRKIREILLALKIDHELSKEKILELYFNKIFYGQRAYGAAAAAKIYYGETLDQLTLAQIAMLAGLPQAPSRLNPITNAQLAKDRRDHVLARMKDLGYIDQTAYQQAIDEPIVASYHDVRPSLTAPFLSEMVRQWVVQQYGKQAYDQGYDIYTTINSQMQMAANQTLIDGLMAYDQRHGYRGPEGRLGNDVLKDIQPLVDQLKQIRIIYGLMPAIVMDVENQSAQVLLSSGQVVTIPWQGLKWARWQLRRHDQVFLGPLPTTANSILKVGNIIRVQEQEDGTYRLAQIPDVQGALMAVDPNQGAVLALNGGFDYFIKNFNHAIQAERQPGSGFKPFFYSSALEKGFTLASIINDAPIAIHNDGGDETDWWRPVNDTNKFYGPTSLRTALIESRNVVSVRLMQQIGVPYVLDYVTRFGFQKTQMPATLSLALGAAQFTPQEMAVAYAVFANGGYKVEPYFIDHVVDDDGKTVYQATPVMVCDPKSAGGESLPACAPRVITPQNDYLMTNVLQDVIRRGTGKNALKLHRNDLAGKTGTTNDEKDAWFTGFNRNLVATVWVGYDRPQSLYEHAAQAAVPIWADFMSLALKDAPETDYPQPQGIVTIKINPKTGLRANSNDPNAKFEIFDQQYLPPQKENDQSAPEDDANTANINQLY